jgi:hypothetical protein
MYPASGGSVKVRNGLFSFGTVARSAAAVAIATALVLGGGVIPEPAYAQVFAGGHISTGSVFLASLVAPSRTTSTSLEATPSATTTPALKAAPAPKAKKKKKLTVRQKVAKAGRDRGLSKKEVAALLWICKRESNFHSTSVSRSGCYGLFQLSRGMAKGHPWKKPVWNTKRAIKYMRGRYGSVLKAKAFWKAHHWY